MSPNKRNGLNKSSFNASPDSATSSMVSRVYISPLAYTLNPSRTSNILSQLQYKASIGATRTVNNANVAELVPFSYANSSPPSAFSSLLTLLPDFVRWSRRTLLCHLTTRTLLRQHYSPDLIPLGLRLRRCQLLHGFQQRSPSAHCISDRRFGAHQYP